MKKKLLAMTVISTLATSVVKAELSSEQVEQYGTILGTTKFCMFHYVLTNEDRVESIENLHNSIRNIVVDTATKNQKSKISYTMNDLVLSLNTNATTRQKEVLCEKYYNESKSIKK